MNKKRILIYVLMIICIVCMTFSLYNIFNWTNDNKKTDMIILKVQEIVKEDESDSYNLMN